ncbi:MAG: invasion associated locus B family protein [Pseudomonadota bacterium]
MMRLSKLCLHGIKIVVSAGVMLCVAFTGGAFAQAGWFKLCNDQPLLRKKEDGKVEKFTKNICNTVHERWNPNTGKLNLGVSVSKVEGEEKLILSFIVPTDVLIEAGIHVAIFDKEQFENLKTKKDQADKADNKDRKSLRLKYVSCSADGCHTETEVTPELLDAMIKGEGGLGISFVTSLRRIVHFPPLSFAGFGDAHSGEPLDNKKYAEARRGLIRQVQERIRSRLAEQATGGLLPDPQKVE